VRRWAPLTVTRPAPSPPGGGALPPAPARRRRAARAGLAPRSVLSRAGRRRPPSRRKRRRRRGRGGGRGRGRDAVREISLAPGGSVCSHRRAGELRRRFVSGALLAGGGPGPVARATVTGAVLRRPALCYRYRAAIP